MRTALSVLMLFAVAVAAALLAGNNQGTVTLFWPPHRVDVSLNLVLLVLVIAFVTVHLALRALAALFEMPRQARRWRIQQRERAVFVSLLDALLHMTAGRFIRARKAAEMALSHEDRLREGGTSLPYSPRLRTMANLLAAQSAHTLQDKDARLAHFQLALQVAGQRDATEAREGVQLRAARWAMDDHDAAAALKWLDELPLGAARRTAALRLRLQAARMAGQAAAALDTARLLAKHRAFPEAAGHSIVRGLIAELVASAREPGQLNGVWQALEAGERSNASLATLAAQRLLDLGGSAEVSRQWLLPAWEQMVANPLAMEHDQRLALIVAVERSFGAGKAAPDTAWLHRIESAQLRYPGDAMLQHLAGIACKQLQLWGKAHQMLNQSLPKLRGSLLEQSAWTALAEMAEQRGDAAAAMQAWRSAARTARQDQD